MAPLTHLTSYLSILMSILVHIVVIRITDLSMSYTFMSVCAAVDCEILTDPNNGDVMFTTTTYLSIANYTCDTGYNLVGVNQRTCTAAGTWSDGEPTCQSERYMNR